MYYACAILYNGFIRQPLQDIIAYKNCFEEIKMWRGLADIKCDKPE